MKSFSIDFYGGMLWAVDKMPSIQTNDIRDTSTAANIILTKPRLDFDKLGYDTKGFLNAGYRGPVEFDITKIYNISLPITIVGWEGAISSFSTIPPYNQADAHSGMHVDTWMSMGVPTGKMANGVFGVLKTGDSGVANNNNVGISLNLNNKLYLNYWAHNMRRAINPQGTDDWHVGYTLYYLQGMAEKFKYSFRL